MRSVIVQVTGRRRSPGSSTTLKPGKLLAIVATKGSHRNFRRITAKAFGCNVTFAPLRRETNATSIQLDVSANVTKGPFVRVGKLIAKGNRRTKTSVLNSRIKLEAGEPLNRVEAEQSRQSLARLGVFNSVRLTYEAVDDSTRDVVYEVRKGNRFR